MRPRPTIPRRLPTLFREGKGADFPPLSIPDITIREELPGTYQYHERISGPEASVRTRYLVDFTITMSGFKFSVHTTKFEK
jgi:hypothetical protein